jgi:hypothetical protein
MENGVGIQVVELNPIRKQKAAKEKDEGETRVPGEGMRGKLPGSL